MDKNNNVPGSYIVRQCGLDFDTYFLDIIVKKYVIKDTLLLLILITKF